MLFAAKNHLLPTLLLWVGFSAGALLAKNALGLTWNFELDAGFVWQVLLALAIVVSSDAIGHGLLRLAFGQRYMTRYRALVEFFTPQHTPEILASGLLASSEEWLFRGVILQSIALSVSPAVGIAVSAVLFGLCHFVRQRMLSPFALWAVWEGVLLGLVYLFSGSMLVAMSVHALHDIGGYLLFAFQRRTGWLLAA